MANPNDSDGDQVKVVKEDGKDINKEIARLQQQRLREAEAKINAILQEYNVELRGVVTIPTTTIQLVPK